MVFFFGFFFGFFTISVSATGNLMYWLFQIRIIKLFSFKAETNQGSLKCLF